MEDELWVVAVKPMYGVPKAAKILGGMASHNPELTVSYFFDLKEEAEEYAKDMNTLIKTNSYKVYRALVRLEKSDG